MIKETRESENDFFQDFKKTLMKWKKLTSIRQSVFLIGVLSILVFLVISAIGASKQESYINSLSTQNNNIYSGNNPGNGCCGFSQFNLGTTDGFPSSRGCCGGGSGGVLSQKDIEKIKEEALRYYQQKYGGQADSAKVTDYGCHIQIDFYKEGKLAKSFSYRNGQLFEL